MLITLEQWIKDGKQLNKTFSRKKGAIGIKIKTNCVTCGKIVIKNPSAIKHGNIDKICCSRSCAVTQTNLTNKNPSKQPGYRDKYIRTSEKNGTLQRGSKNWNWIEDRGYLIKRQKIAHKTGQHLRLAMTGSYTIGKHKQKYEEMYGYSAKELRDHILSQLKDGWSMDNYIKVWVIDHIKPISTFVKEKCYDLKKISSLENLRPLDKIENNKIAVGRRKRV